MLACKEPSLGTVCCNLAISALKISSSPPQTVEILLKYGIQCIISNHITLDQLALYHFRAEVPDTVGHLVTSRHVLTRDSYHISAARCAAAEVRHSPAAKTGTAVVPPTGMNIHCSPQTNYSSHGSSQSLPELGPQLGSIFLQAAVGCYFGAGQLC